jgi:ABC-type antimicrobial peptide transport system permease subunit
MKSFSFGNKDGPEVLALVFTSIDAVYSSIAEWLKISAGKFVLCYEIKPNTCNNIIDVMIINTEGNESVMEVTMIIIESRYRDTTAGIPWKEMVLKIIKSAVKSMIHIDIVNHGKIIEDNLVVEEILEESISLGAEIMFGIFFNDGNE